MEYTIRSQKYEEENKASNKLIEIIQEGIRNKKNYYLAICHGYAQEEADKIRVIMQPYIDNATIFIEGQISPALGVHTGPGLVGIGYFDLN